jgi:dipeptidyl-peptidase-4
MPCRRITSRDVASIPQPGFNLVELIHFSPDDHLLTYLRSPNQSLIRQLYAYDLRNDREYVYAELEENDDITEDNLSIEEQFQREVGVFFFI